MQMRSVSHSSAEEAKAELNAPNAENDSNTESEEDEEEEAKGEIQREVQPDESRLSSILEASEQLEESEIMPVDSHDQEVE